jgi:hypothetical protein
MSALAFDPAPTLGDCARRTVRAAIKGTFRSPRGRTGTKSGHLRQRLVIVPRGAFITGVFTGELRETDGTLVGAGSRRATVSADLERDESGLQPVARPLQLDRMGITIEVPPFVIEPALAFPRGRAAPDGGHAERSPRKRSREPL